MKTKTMQYTRQDGTIAQLVQFDNFKGYSEELGKETDFGVQLIDENGGLLKICDLDGETIPKQNVTWELPEIFPSDVITAFDSWNEGL